jgi:hypothetical protein
VIFVSAIGGEQKTATRGQTMPTGGAAEGYPRSILWVAADVDVSVTEPGARPVHITGHIEVSKNASESFSHAWNHRL